MLKRRVHTGAPLYLSVKAKTQIHDLNCQNVKKQLSVHSVSCNPSIIHLFKIYLLSIWYVPDMIVAASGECE